MPTPTKPDLTTRIEGAALVVILILVALAAGWASFSHVHDWTMHHVPAGTPDTFGWVNAIISELVPVAALLTIRRRKRIGAPIGYPLFLLLAFAGFSLAAQLAVAGRSPSGWLLSAIPALAFIALVKLVLAPVKTGAEAGPGSDDQQANDATEPTITRSDHTPEPAPVVTESEPPTPPAIQPRPEVPAHLLPTARFAAVQHQQATGQTITADELAVRLNITPLVAGQLLHTINPPTARINGATVTGGGVR